MASDAGSIVAAIADACRAGGFDLHATTTAGRYNATVDPAFHLPGADGSVVMVIGNTRELWPHVERFVLECKTSDQDMLDPIDTYTERTIHAAITGIRGVVDIRFAHEPPPRRIAIQRLAHVAGLAWLSPSHLCIHRTVGPWMALRAAIVLNDSVPSATSLPSPELGPPCVCERQCLPKLEAALGAGEPTNRAELTDQWRLWLVMRDACPVGRDYRYTDEQIAYHYIGKRPAHWA